MIRAGAVAMLGAALVWAGLVLVRWGASCAIWSARRMGIELESHDERPPASRAHLPVPGIEDLRVSGVRQ